MLSASPRSPMRYHQSIIIILLFIALATTVRTTTAINHDYPIGHAAFWSVWERQDLPVEHQMTDERSWTWGAVRSPLLNEPFADAPSASRQVQYFDKSRMEINDPAAPFSDWYVTNGLLPVEMMTGRIQTGLDHFEEGAPARISAIGDPGTFPTYANLLTHYHTPGSLAPTSLNTPVTDMLHVDGTITPFLDYADDPATMLIADDHGSIVVQAFYDFQNQTGVVWQHGAYTTANVYNPLFVFGFPVTKPYWVSSRVGGQEVPILFQVFERRVLTYNPTNPPAFRVEMGNVGQHFYQWRYQSGERPVQPRP